MPMDEYSQLDWIVDHMAGECRENLQRLLLVANGLVDAK